MDFSLLGKATVYKENYDPTLLFSVARSEKRLEIGLVENELPFQGEDVWNAYEISWLNPKGKPQVALGEFRFPANSTNLVESKSLKLYLNSFNQTVFADCEEVRQRIAADLSRVATVPVAVQVLMLADAYQRVLGGDLGECLDQQDIEINFYAGPNPIFLTASEGQVSAKETLYSHLLKSNCLVTGQPDWATLVVQYEGPKIDREGLLRYIVSFRQHNEFHEQCVERIFFDIFRHCQPLKLSVWARYTRRGGVDINPWRSTDVGFGTPPNFFDLRQ
jgi:7-cyano-7-deazaguanine reductase